MARKQYNRTGQIPRNLFEMINIKKDAEIDVPCQIFNVLEDMHESSWFNNSQTWYHFLDNVLDDWIYNNYAKRFFKSDLIDEFEAPFDNDAYYSTNPSYSGWFLSNGIYSDYSYLSQKISNICYNVFKVNQEKYKKLYDAMTLEFNPLWNVDGTETTVRTLEKDGTISTAKDGYDELSRTGHDDVIHSGKDTTTKSGSFDAVRSGSQDMHRLGDDETTFSGSEASTRTGSRELKTQGGEITTHEEATTDSQSMITTTKDNTFYGVDGVIGDLADSKIETESFTNLRDQKTFTDREDSIHHDVTDTTTYNDVTDELEHGEKVENKYLSKHRTTYDVDDVQTFDTVDTERISLERHGNIGVTTTTKLLSEYVDYAEYFNYVDIVAKDLIEAFTLGVY